MSNKQEHSATKQKDPKRQKAGWRSRAKYMLKIKEEILGETSSDGSKPTSNGSSFTSEAASNASKSTSETANICGKYTTSSTINTSTSYIHFYSIGALAVLPIGICVHFTVYSKKYHHAARPEEGRVIQLRNQRSMLWYCTEKLCNSSFVAEISVQY